MGSPSVGRPAPRRLAPRPDFQAMPHRMSEIHGYDLDIGWDKFIDHLRRPGRAPRSPFMAPDLPGGFVERPRELDQLRAPLPEADRMDPVAMTTSLIGAGGFGKTTPAAAVCPDDDGRSPAQQVTRREACDPAGRRGWHGRDPAHRPVRE
jgi:hypothetical protein